MLAKLQQHAGAPINAVLRRHSHILFVLPQASQLASTLPGRKVVAALLARRQMKAGELGKIALAGNFANGALAAWVMADAAKTLFESQSTIRNALQTLLAENPQGIAIVVLGDAAQRRYAAEIAIYCAWVNGAVLPERKKKSERKPLKTVDLYGYLDPHEFPAQRACAEGNLLCRELTVLPPNELTPGAYRKRIKRLAKEYGWEREEYDFGKLRKMGAGAFCAVAQGSATDDAAIVHLSYSHAQAKQRVALVGKGICFDTGGHNLKPARHMHSMHEDMNGSAVALGILVAATRMKLPVNIDCWMALAQNHISPTAYKQNDVVTALNGTTIEVMHTDAEGRMVLADALTLAACAKPRLIVDFATLTGSMHVALGDRYSGVLRLQTSWRRKRWQRAGPQANAYVCFRWTPITTARSTARSPTSSSARSKAKPITYSQRGFSSALSVIRLGYTSICQAAAAKAASARSPPMSPVLAWHGVSHCSRPGGDGTGFRRNNN